MSVSPEEAAEILLGMLDAHDKEVDHEASRNPYRDYRVRVPLEAAGPIQQAAAARGMSIAAYSRRAVTAFAAFDLGLDPYALLKLEPATRLKSEGPKSNRYDRGEEHGHWMIKGLI